MNGAPPTIEIIRPFGQAVELTKRILFEPFNFEKWLVIGFAAFLTYLTGGGFNFRFPVSGNWRALTPQQQENIRSFLHELTPVWLVLIAIGVLLAFAVFVVLTWIRSRGHFVFIDCIVRNRGAIVEPWKEYCTEGNSYFLFSLCFFVCLIAFVVAIALVVVLPIFIINPREHGTIAFLPLSAALIIILPTMLLLLSLIQFVAPLMYCRRCTAWPVITDLLSLLGNNLGVFTLYVLFGIAVGIAVAIAMVTLTCMTCCIAAIPYVGTVILLPIYVFVQSFPLLFIRQFGAEYDVWSAVRQPPPIPPPPPS